MNKEEIVATVYNMIYEQDTTNKKSCLSLAEEITIFIEELSQYKEQGVNGVTRIPTASSMTFNPPLQREIYKVNRPVFILWTYKVDESGEKILDNRVLTTTMHKGMLKDYIDSYPDRHIFFYEEITTEIFKGNVTKIVRATSIEKEPGVVISLTDSDYEKIIV
jgi:hypothetical protein